jgi:4-amino-4-deoxy-L-arabinose transferase-like glycosyltransferase
MEQLIARLLRPGRSGAYDVRLDVIWLCLLSLLLIATGIGLRDPWPADEPRFALIARDMVLTHQWLFPRVGGDLYADKPPLFFWFVASLLLLTGSLRWAFLLPSLLAGIGCVLLVYDLARRLWTREVGLAAGLALLMTVQFVWEARQAQLDATVCFFTTLGLYGLLRHCLLGPSWKWYAAGWAAAGLGIITKGVGFLPLLVLIPYAFIRGDTWNPRPVVSGGWRWLLGPLALIAAVSIWLVPMLLAARHDPALQAYRDEILFGQTVARYTGASHHRQPFWYFIVEVIPVLWLPLVALLPWLITRWIRSWRQRDLRVVLPLAWTVLVLLFFSLSSGKRGVYILPALPGLALAAAPWLASVAQRRGAQRVLYLIACAAAAVTLGAAVYLLAAPHRELMIDSYGIDGVAPLLTMGIASALVCFIARPKRGFAAYGLMLTITLLVISYWVNPAINSARSGERFIRHVQAMTGDVMELGIVAAKEQYLLHLTRPVVNFGHRRWRDADQEVRDAALWLSHSNNRALLVTNYARETCFSGADTRHVGTANREDWFLVRGAPNPSCVTRGNPQAAIAYATPVLRTGKPDQ